MTLTINGSDALHNDFDFWAQNYKVEVLDGETVIETIESIGGEELGERFELFVDDIDEENGFVAELEDEEGNTVKIAMINPPNYIPD